MRPRLRFLSDKLIRRILDEAYHLLETRGVTLHHETLQRRLAEAGCLLDADSGRVRMPREVVETAVRSAPNRIELWNIAGDSFCDLSGDSIHFTPGSTAIKMLDEETHRMRPVSTDDMLRYGNLVEQLDAIDYSATAVVPNDVPNAIGDSIRLYALLKKTSKAIVTGAFTIEGFNVMAEMHLAVRGTGEALRAKPFTIFSCCPTSPLKWSTTTADNTARCAELGIPVEFIAMPLAGLVAPISLVGCVIQHTAETLSGIVISQTTCPGAPILYGGSPGVFDMRTMTATVSTVEAQMIDCAYIEVGKYLGLPTQTYTGMSDSKTLDAQAGFESGGGLYLAGLAGVNSVSGPGMHYFESCLSLEKLVFDAQLCDITRRLAAGLEPREDFPADALFDELLREKTLLTADHTIKYFRQEHCIPGPLIDRTQIQGHRSVPDLMQRARDEVEGHLARYEPPDVLSAEQCRDLEDIMTAAAGDFSIDF
ncbi:MAG: trimethylamine methyltransferase family protein [Desulfobacterales bacterium]